MNVNSVKTIDIFLSRPYISLDKELFIYKTVIMNGLLYFIAGFFEFIGIFLSLPAVIFNTIANYFYNMSGLTDYNDTNENEE